MVKGSNSHAFYVGVKEIVGAVLIMATLLGIGYGLGTYKSEFDLRMQKLELGRECDARVAHEINQAREANMRSVSTKVENLELLVRHLSEKQK